MTDQEIKDLVASLAVSQRETDRQLKETDRQLKETDRQLKETDQQLKETDSYLRERFAETDRKMAEYAIKTEADREITERQLRALGQQIGGLGNKFGGFAEGMALPSMERILMDELGMDSFSPRVKRKIKGGRQLEIDAMGYANGDKNLVYIVEIKSHVDAKALTQMERTLSCFAEVFTEHAGKEVRGILTYIDSVDREVLEKARQKGHLIAHIHDELFELEDLPAA